MSEGDSERFYLCLTCGQLKRGDLFEKGDCTCQDCYQDVENGTRKDASRRFREALHGDGYLYMGESE